jgi:porphobilinogen deaminase
MMISKRAIYSHEVAYLGSWSVRRVTLLTAGRGDGDFQILRWWSLGNVGTRTTP